MMYVGLSKPADRAAVEAAFARHAPDARLQWGEPAWERLGENDAADVFLTVRSNPSEFPFRLDIHDLSGRDVYELGLQLARELSIALQCSTVCDGTLHGPSQAPGWCIVWIEGRAFLGDDYGSVFFDHSDDDSEDERSRLGPVKLIRPLDL